MQLGPAQPVKRRPAIGPKVPVDTVRLKRDIADDAKKLSDRARVAGQLDAAGKKPQGDAAMHGSMDDMQRLVARQDTLEKVRRGSKR